MSTVTVSFSLFGTDPLYQLGAIRNAEMYHEKRPNWDLRFYIGHSIDSDTRVELLKANPRARIVEVDERENAASTWWRMRALLDFEPPPTLLFRDVDSRPCARELAAVDEWLAQDLLYAHALRDHEYHGAVILAGLWGLKGPGIMPVASKLRPKIPDFWTTDQIELQMKVFPMVRRHLMAHIGSSHIYEKPAQRRPFRVPRDPGGFVGQGFNGDETPRSPEHVTPEMLLTDEYLLSRDDVFERKYRTPYAEGN